MNLPSSPLTLTLLRHGRSRADEGVHEGCYDSPPTAAGEAQAVKLAAYWFTNPPGFERVVCSSLATRVFQKFWYRGSLVR